jgi:hypothetical protein
MIIKANAPTHILASPKLTTTITTRSTKMELWLLAWKRRLRMITWLSKEGRSGRMFRRADVGCGERG